ncbi:MAG: dihydrodipicolinate synthase family protein [Minwuia sp.]|uniref:dihydrodipicolinate synthase family protein n=1 Tax=Minwuia sp. TaxID=2493630 RepID=UPI003A8B3672
MAAGAHGMAALGLATEVHKLSPAERHQIMRWLVEDVGDRVPVAITVYGNTSAEQIEFVGTAAELGVDWVILQPPRDRHVEEDELVDFFGGVMAACPLPVGIQNAPHYLANSLSDDGLRELARRHENFRLLKGEGSALDIRATIETLGDRLSVFNGRGGLELTDNIRAGCAGMIIAPELVDIQVRIVEAIWQGRHEEADRLYRDMLPLVTFLMQSIDRFVCYGKRLTARRLGLGEVFDRTPSEPPTDFGLAALERHAAGIGPLP